MIRCIVFSDFTGGAGKAASGETISQDILIAHAAAVQEQLCGPYADAWDGAKVYCRAGAPNGGDVGEGEYLLGYWQSPDVAGAAGYHATDPSGRPYAKVFLDDAQTMNSGPQAASVIASHEALEMFADPTGNILALRADGQTFDCFEMSDAVQDQTYAASNGVEVSDFLLPAAFDPGAIGPYDYMKALTGQYDTTSGGYRITGSASMSPGGAMRFEAKGNGLSDPRRLAKIKRDCARAALRGKVVFP